jgi:hypothetical protein
MRGQDGNMWVIKVDRNGRGSWKKYSRVGKRQKIRRLCE